jgi:hypothetical protein
VGNGLPDPRRKKQSSTYLRICTARADYGKKKLVLQCAVGVPDDTPICLPKIPILVYFNVLEWKIWYTYIIIQYNLTIVAPFRNVWLVYFCL